MRKLIKNKGITLISLVITIIVLIILASVGIYLSLGNNGIFTKAQEAKEKTQRETATEKINLKITTAQMNSYAEKQEMPTLKELSLILKEDSEISYVTEESKVASAEYNVPSDNPSTIYTKLKDYNYEFGINSSLQLASIDGVKVAANNGSQSSRGVNYSLEETKTNDTWMGKPIYTKIIYIPELPNATDVEYNHNIGNAENIWVDMSNSYIINNNVTPTSYGTLPYVHDISSELQISVGVDRNKIYISSRKSNRTTWSAYCTVRYTKTTDTVQ